MLALTVSQLNRYVKSVLEEDPKLGDLYIKGEIANFTCHYKSGHFYFSLRDAASSVKAVMFKSHADRVKFEPESGMSVLVRAHVSLYERDGSYQLYVTDMQPDGAGAMAVAFEQRKTKLAALGLFDESCKKPLPPYPARIGVVTSETGAALQDIVNVLTRRYPLGRLVFCPAQVQGDEAVPGLIAALKTLDTRCDVIILGRGGGSAEDLWCFNDESLARAVFAVRTPVISAVGHETDYTICDFVADVRAPTPSAAAELAVPSAEALQGRLSRYGEYLRRAADLRLDRERERLGRLAGTRALSTPLHTVEKKREALDFLYDSLYNNKQNFLNRLSGEIARRGELLDSMSPLRVLERGYAAALNERGEALSASRLRIGERIWLRLCDGEALARVEQVTASGAQRPEDREERERLT